MIQDGVKFELRNGYIKFDDTLYDFTNMAAGFTYS
jgi:hypothetical protein